MDMILPFLSVDHCNNYLLGKGSGKKVRKTYCFFFKYYFRFVFIIFFIKCPETIIIDFNTELGSLWLTNLPLNEMKKTAILLECTF